MTLQIDMEAVQRGVIQDVANSVWEDEKWFDHVRAEINTRIDKLFSERVEAALTSAIDAAVKDGFEREYHAVDSFGKKAGETTSIKAELERMISRYWSERVDVKSGKPSESTYSSVSRAEYLMTKICAEDFSKAMKASALNVTGALKDGFRNQIGKHMDNMLDSLFKIKSLQDQGKVEKPY